METLRFSLLGPLEVQSISGPLLIEGVRRRTLLVRLLVSVNKPVGSDVLVRDLWGDRPGSGAGSTLQSHVSLLRKVLGPDRVVSAQGGYKLIADPLEVAAVCFESQAR